MGYMTNAHSFVLDGHPIEVEKQGMIQLALYWTSPSRQSKTELQKPLPL